MLFLDGVSVDRPDGTIQFRCVKAPNRAERAQLAHGIARGTPAAWNGKVCWSGMARG